MEKLVTIGITSYKRIKELERCIRSVQTKYKDDIEIIVSEDCSPLSAELGEMVNNLAKEIDYPLCFMPNKKNLGYDMNLGAIIEKSNGKYIYFMSDDDYIYPNSLDAIIEFLKCDNDYGVIYGAYEEDDMSIRRTHGYNHEIANGVESVKKYLYDSILFSGLIFRKDFVKDFDASRFKNYNYFQVYLFCKMLIEYGGYSFANPTVKCVMDGENAYGISESSGGNALLADRSNAMSILEFNKKLFEIIKVFDKEEKTDVFSTFEKQYSMHSYTALSFARKAGGGIL